jgi:hypothetical protein
MKERYKEFKKLTDDDLSILSYHSCRIKTIEGFFKKLEIKYKVFLCRCKNNIFSLTRIKFYFILDKKEEFSDSLQIAFYNFASSVVGYPSNVKYLCASKLPKCKSFILLNTDLLFKDINQRLP